VRTLMAFKRGEPRVCSMARAPTPQEEDRRRVCRERRTLVGERVKHVNRIKRTALRLGGVRLRAAAQGSA
jgi:transposase